MAPEISDEMLTTSGPYEVLIILLLSLPQGWNAMESMGSNFLYPKQDYWCAEKEENITSYNTHVNLFNFVAEDKPYILDPVLLKGNQTDAECPYGYEYDMSTHGVTVTTEFNLVEENAWILELIGPLYMAGFGAGSFFSGLFSDRIGRKRTFMWMSALHFVSCMVAGLAPNVWVFAMARIFVGLGNKASALSGMTLMLELVADSDRVIGGLVFQILYAVGAIAVTAMAYYLRDFRMLELTVAMSTIIKVSYYWLIPESPRWLLARGYTERALGEVEWLAKRTGREIPPELMKEYSKQKMKNAKIEIVEKSKDAADSPKSCRSIEEKSSLNNCSPVVSIKGSKPTSVCEEIYEEIHKDIYEETCEKDRNYSPVPCSNNGLKTAVSSSGTAKRGSEIFVIDGEMEAHYQNIAELSAGKCDMGTNNADELKKKVDSGKEVTKMDYIDLVQHPVMRSYTLTLCFCSPIVVLIYNGLGLNMGTLVGNIYINVILASVIDIPLYIGAIHIVNRAGCYRIISLFYGIALLTMFGSVPMLYIEGASQFSTYLSLVGRAIVGGSGAIIWIYCNELYPTALRQRAVGTFSSLGGVISIAAPVIGGTLAEIWRPLPLVIYGSVATLALLLFLRMPNTTGCPMATTIEDSVNVRNIKRQRQDSEMRFGGRSNRAFSLADERWSTVKGVNYKSYTISRVGTTPFSM